MKFIWRAATFAEKWLCHNFPFKIQSLSILKFLLFLDCLRITQTLESLHRNKFHPRNPITVTLARRIRYKVSVEDAAVTLVWPFINSIWMQSSTQTGHDCCRTIVVLVSCWCTWLKVLSLPLPWLFPPRLSACLVHPVADPGGPRGPCPPGPVKISHKKRSSRAAA